MKLDNDQIEQRVNTFVDAYVKESQERRELKPEEIAVVHALQDLAVNFLQCLNDLAYCAINKEERNSQR